MPHEIVWVEKILNPRSAVLNHNEALTILKNTKDWINSPRLKAPTNKNIHGTSNPSIAAQKEEYIQLRKMFMQKDEMKPIGEMKAELEAMVKSKEVFKKAIAENKITPDGLPRLKPSLILQKELAKNKKNKARKIADRLASIGKAAINKNALQQALNDSDDENAEIMEVDGLKEVKDEVDYGHEVTKKRRRIHESDDEEKEVKIKEEKMDMLDLKLPFKIPYEPSESTLRLADNCHEFKASFSNYIQHIDDDSPLTVTFEADGNQTNVIAAATDVKEDIDDSHVPTNVMFTNKAVSGSFNPPVFANDNYEEGLREHWFGNSYGHLGSTALDENLQFRLPDVRRSGKIPYAELVKDENFCKELLEAAEVEYNVSSMLGIDVEEDDEDREAALPKLQTLNSLFTADDMNILQYKADMGSLNASRVRERQRVQHPIVKVRPHFKAEQSFGGSIAFVSKHHVSFTNVLKRRSKSSGVKHVKSEAENKACIPHNTVIHEALKYLDKSKTAHRYQTEIKEAYKKLSKYPLTFLEKSNLIHTHPKDLPGMLCMLDDLGLRFNKDALEKFERDCASIFPPKRYRTRRMTSSSETG